MRSTAGKERTVSFSLGNLRFLATESPKNERCKILLDENRWLMRVT